MPNDHASRGEKTEKEASEVCLSVSVIIPTYNRADMLRQTLASFLEQSYPRDKFEILVSDNNSGDNTREVVAEFERQYPKNVRYLWEPRQGAHYARNTAAKAASGEILYFTDDDMIADTHLLAKLVGVFVRDPSVACATGSVLPHWQSEPPSWILRHCQNGWLSLNLGGDKAEEIGPEIDVWGCHQAVRREVFFRTGGYGPDNTAGQWIGDGDTGLNSRIRKLGFNFAFVKDSKIYHVIPAERLTQRYLNSRFANQGSVDSYTAYREHRFTKPELWRENAKLLRLSARKLRRFLGFFVMGDERWRFERASINYSVNRIRYNIRLLTSERWRQMVLKENWLDEQ